MGARHGSPFPRDPVGKNMPVLLALLGICTTIFFLQKQKPSCPMTNISIGSAPIFSKAIWKATAKALDGILSRSLILLAPSSGRTRNQRPACLLPTHPSRDQIHSLRFYCSGLEPSSFGPTPSDSLIPFFGSDRSPHARQKHEEVVKELKAQGLEEAQIEVLALTKFLKAINPPMRSSSNRSRHEAWAA